MSDAKEAAAGEKKKGGSMKLIIIGVVALLVLGGGGGAAWYFLKAKAPAEGETVEKSEKAEKGAKSEKKSAAGKKKKKAEGDGVVALDQFLVNLADKDANRFVRLKVGLIVETKEEAKELSENDVFKARVRSAIIELLTQQTAEKLTTPEGKNELRELIVEHCETATGESVVLDVLFTDFVVQF